MQACQTWNIQSKDVIHKIENSFHIFCRKQSSHLPILQVIWEIIHLGIS